MTFIYIICVFFVLSGYRCVDKLLDRFVGKQYFITLLLLFRKNDKAFVHAIKQLNAFFILSL